MTADAQVQAIASALNVMRPDEPRFEIWIGAMESGDYKFGFGLLRSADDEYDPFGVLAAISCPDWQWDDVEGSWAINGSPLFVESKQIAEWLDIPSNPSLEAAGLLNTVDRFQAAVTEIADGATSFDEVAKLLKEADRRARSERERLKRAAMDRRDMIPRYSSDEIDRSYYQKSRSPYGQF